MMGLFDRTCFPSMVLALAATAYPAPAARAHPASAVESLADVGAQLRGARDRQDWPAYAAAAGRQKELLNGSPASHLEVARADLYLQDPSGAADEVRAFARMGQTSELLETAPELAPLRASQDFAGIREQLAANRQPIAGSSTVFVLQDAGLLPEDIDYDRTGKRFFISSVLEKKIITVTMQGVSADFAAAPEGWPILALKVDGARQRLWASEAALQEFANIDPAQSGRSAILCYDLRSGKLLARIEAPRPSALGDMALMPDGTVIASDGQEGALYRVGLDLKVERIDAGDFISPQTPVVLGNGERIIVPDYVRGLGLLSLKTQKVDWFSTVDRYALDGMDGLYRSGRRLIAIQNGTSPQRVVVFSLDHSFSRIAEERVVDRNTPLLGVPTHGVVVDGNFYYIANSGWDALDEKGTVRAGSKLSAASVMVFALPRS